MSWAVPVPLLLLRWPTPVPRWTIETYGTTLAVIAASGLAWVALWLLEQRL